MNTDATRQNQEQHDSEIEKDEINPNLSIAEKCAVTFNGHGLDEFITEIDNLAESVSRIVGAKVGQAAIPITSADELAKLLANIRDETPKNEWSRKAHNTLDAAIELAFLHSPVYKDAFEIFMLDLAGRLRGAASAYEAIHETLLTVSGETKATPERTVFKLCEYENLSLDFYLTEDGDKAFSFELVRRNLESDQVYFNVWGEKLSSFVRDGYNFPPRKDAVSLKESHVLAGYGRFLFLGYRDIPTFSFSYNNSEHGFEGNFNVIGENGEAIQSLALL